jgi:hypothetical protein
MTKIPSLFPSSSQQGIEFHFDLIPSTRPTFVSPIICYDNWRSTWILIIQVLLRPSVHLGDHLGLQQRGVVVGRSCVREHDSQKTASPLSMGIMNMELCLLDLPMPLPSLWKQWTIFYVGSLITCLCVHWRDPHILRHTKSMRAIWDLCLRLWGRINVMRS